MSKATPHLNKAIENQRRVLKLCPGESTSSSRCERSLLGGLAIRTQAEVAELLGTSPQNVQQIERIAFGKLRRRLSGFWKELQEC